LLRIFKASKYLQQRRRVCTNCSKAAEGSTQWWLVWTILEWSIDI
jgi:hypothetical protein